MPDHMSLHPIQLTHVSDLDLVLIRHELKTCTPSDVESLRVIDAELRTRSARLISLIPENPS
jgi:hypothetical protein